MQAGLGHVFGDQQSMNNISKHVKLSVTMIVASFSLQINIFFFSVSEKCDFVFVGFFKFFCLSFSICRVVPLHLISFSLGNSS